jgi:hypothetical protein
MEHWAKGMKDEISRALTTTMIVTIATVTSDGKRPPVTENRVRKEREPCPT